MITLLHDRSNGRDAARRRRTDGSAESSRSDASVRPDMAGDLQRLSAAVAATAAHIARAASGSVSPDLGAFLATASAALSNSVIRPLDDIVGNARDHTDTGAAVVSL